LGKSLGRPRRRIPHSFGKMLRLARKMKIGRWLAGGAPILVPGSFW
jgi:hypothetical protein